MLFIPTAILGRSTPNPLGCVCADRVLGAPEKAPRQKNREKPGEWVLCFEDPSIRERAEVGGHKCICRSSSHSKENKPIFSGGHRQLQ